jgi:rhodanese-related sulfurtransferase
VKDRAVEQFLLFLQKSPFNMLLFGLALSSGGMLLWPLLSRPFRQTHEVGPFEAVQLINRRDAVVLDVRDTGDYAAGHIAGARHVPESQVAGRLKELEKYKARPLVVACRTGSRAPAISALLRKQGFAEAFTLRGGVAAWQQASLPLEKG